MSDSSSALAQRFFERSKRKRDEHVAESLVPKPGVVLNGMLENFLFPRFAKQHRGGFAIATLRSTKHGGDVETYTLKFDAKSPLERAAMPRLLAPYNNYEFRAIETREQRDPRFSPRTTWRVVETLSESRAPFTRALLEQMLRRELGMARPAASVAAADALGSGNKPAPPYLKELALDDARLDALAAAPWFDQLYERCDYFAADHLRRLTNVWPLEKLQRCAMPPQRLGVLERALAARPYDFCFRWLLTDVLPEYASGAGASFLDELSLQQLVKIAPQYVQPALSETRLEVDALRLYTLLKLFHADGDFYVALGPSSDARYAERRTRLSMVNEMRMLVSRNGMRDFMTRRRLLALVDSDVDGEEECLYSYGDIAMLAQLNRSLRRVAERPLRAERSETEKDPLDSLSPEQRAAVYAATSRDQRATLITGSAGCGKTHTGHALYRCYAEGEVLPLAFMGLTSLLLKKRYGRGTTADKIVTRIQRALAKDPLVRDPATGSIVEGGDPKMRPRILLIDEFSTLSMRLMARVLEELERNGAEVEHIVWMGDVEQNPAIERGAFMPSFLRAYGETPVVQRLLTNHRVSAESRLLIALLRRIRDGLFDGTECARLLDDGTVTQPVLSEFAGVPCFLVRRPYFHDAAAACLSTLLSSSGHSQLLVQRNVERRLFNELLFSRCAEFIEAFRADGIHRYEEFHFAVGERVMLLENSDGSPPREPKRTHSSSVKNGDIVHIDEIVDVALDEAVGERAVRTTAAAPSFTVGTPYRRIIRFRRECEGEPFGVTLQIVVDRYSLYNVTRTHAVTIAKLQGQELDTVVLYVHADFSSTFARSDLFVACSRARKRIYIMCNTTDNTGSRSGRVDELARLSGQLAAERSERLEAWLPDFSDG